MIVATGRRHDKKAERESEREEEKSREAVSEKFPGRNGPRKEYCLFCGSRKVLTKEAHVEWRIVFWRWQNRFPSIANPVFRGILRRPRRAEKSARTFTRWSRMHFHVSSGDSGEYFSRLESQFPPGKQPRINASIPRFSNFFCHISIILQNSTFDEIYSYRLYEYFKDCMNDLPRVLQLRFKSLPNTYLKQTNIHIKINWKLNNISLLLLFILRTLFVINCPAEYR